MTVTTTTTTQTACSHAPSRSGLAVVAATLAIWFAIVLALALAGALTPAPKTPPLPVVIAILVPVALAVAFYAALPELRRAVLALDARLIAVFQAWRVAGFVFIPLMLVGALPGLFAWPAGLGDVAIGVTAPLMVALLARDGSFIASRRFVVWNLAGLLDFVVAVGAGTLASGAFPALAAAPTTALMGALPLVMIPGFLVPLFTILHLVALAQVRARRRAASRA